MEVVFGKGALGKKDSAVRKLVGSYRKGGKKGLMKNYVTVKQVKNWFKDKGNRRWFDLKDNIIDRQVYVAKKGSVAKAGRKYIKSLIEEAKNKKIAFDFDETFQQFNMEDYIKTDLTDQYDDLAEGIEYKKEWRGM